MKTLKEQLIENNRIKEQKIEDSTQKEFLRLVRVVTADIEAGCHEPIFLPLTSLNVTLNRNLLDAKMQDWAHNQGLNLAIGPGFYSIRVKE